MADRTAVAYEIGGALRRSLISALVDVLSLEQADDSYGDGEAITAERIEATAQAGEALRVTANEVPGGNLEDLDAFCREHGLAYRQQWDAHYAFAAGGSLFDGAETVAEYACDGTDGEPSLLASEIRKLGSWEAVCARLDALTKALVLTITEEP